MKDTRRCPNCKHKWMKYYPSCYPEWRCEHCGEMYGDEELEKEDDDV